MRGTEIILLAAGVMAAIGLVATLCWLLYRTWLNGLERRLATRKGPYRELVAGLAERERELLEPAIHQLGTYRDFAALEAVLEEQARESADRPPWLLEAYDRLGLIEKYVERLTSARRWRERAFAAELLGRVGNAKAVPALLDTVNDTRREDADVREIALRALARIGDQRAVPQLVAALRSAEPWLAPRLADILARHGEHAVPPMIEFVEEGGRHHARAWAANVLGEIGAQRAFPVLVRALGDLDDEVRAKSAYALGRLGDRRATPYLLEHLLTDPAPFVRARIAGALGQFGDPEVIERLVRALADPAWWVRMRSVEALEQIGVQAESPLLVAVGDPDPELRMRAAVALDRLGVPARAVRMIEESDRPEQGRDILTRFAAAGARELLAENLLHPSAQVRLAVIAAIRRTGRPDLAQELVQVASADADPMLRAAAFDTLRALELRDSVAAARAALADPHEAVRTEAIHLLGDLGGAEAAPELAACTSDSDAGVRAAAVAALAASLPTAAAPEIRQLLTDPAPPVRAAAAEAAGRTNLGASAPMLITLLGDSDETVRIAAVRALEQLGVREAVPRLVRTLPGATPGLRRAIVSAVARLEPRRLPALCRDRDPAVRVEALDTLSTPGRGKGGQGALAEDALDDPADSVRAAAVNAVVRLGDASQSVRLLDLLAHDPSPQVRERAALAAGLLPIEGAEPALAHACAIEQPAGVRAAAVLALGAFGHESIAGRVAEMTDDGGVREVLHERLRGDREFQQLGARLRQSHSLELRALASPSRDQMERELADGMSSVLDPRERMRAVSGLRALQGDRSRDALLQTLRSDPSSEVRAAALQAVAEMLDRDTLLLTARRALGDPSVVVRRLAVSLFGSMPPVTALRELLQTLRPEDDASVLRAAAVHADRSFAEFADLTLGGTATGRSALVATRIARYVEDPGLPAILPAFARSDDAPVRASLAELLAARPELADQGLVHALTLDPVVAVRRHALRAAAAAGMSVPLAAMADDPDPEVRRDLAMLLRTVPDGGTLLRLQDDSDPRVRAAAVVSGILRGDLTELPSEVGREESAEAVIDAGELADLRQTARTSPDERHRLAAALALGLVGDQVAREVAEADPVRDVRTRVAALLERAG